MQMDEQARQSREQARQHMEQMAVLKEQVKTKEDEMKNLIEAARDGARGIKFYTIGQFPTI